MGKNWATRQTLLERALDKSDQEAWNHFVNYYKGFIEVVIFKMNIQFHDRDDLVQSVLIKIWNNLANFEIDHDKAKFRTWLSRVTRNTVIDYLRHEKRKDKLFSDVHDEQLDDTRNDSNMNEGEIEQIIEKEWMTHITKLALKNISAKFSHQAIQAFTMSLHNMDISQISDKLGIKENSVYKLRNRVKKHMTAEIKNLRQELEF
ncbi:MAG: sigma-70 family RNA polymerase sigma factor [Planctomycetes bacterium]|nr:sigma-70 family RNA polymerase sigma factor [Planctomycetota bacterium]